MVNAWFSMAILSVNSSSGIAGSSPAMVTGVLIAIPGTTNVGKGKYPSPGSDVAVGKGRECGRIPKNSLLGSTDIII
jgi:hypothetical protein